MGHGKRTFFHTGDGERSGGEHAHGHYSAAPPGGPRPGAALRGIQFHRRTQAPGLERLSRRAVRRRGRHHSAPCQPGGCGSLRPGDAHANPHSGLYAYARLFSGARRVHQRAVRGAAPAIGFGRRPVHSRHHRQRAGPRPALPRAFHSGTAGR